MKSSWSLLPAMLAVAACATVPPPVSNYRAERVDLTFPQVSNTRQAAIGEAVIAGGAVTRTRGVTFSKPVKLDQFTLYPGFYPMIGEDADYSYYAFRTMPVGDGMGYIPPARDTILAEWVQAPDAVRISREGKGNGGETCIIFVSLRQTACDRDASFVRDSRDAPTPLDLDRKLIYRGVHNGVIGFTYWEESGNAARPESSREVSFPLQPSGVIDYAGARIRVLSADETSIRYTVLSNFQNYWQGTSR